MRFTTTTTLLLASTLVTARKVPSNLKSFYDSHINGKCTNPISIAYSSGQGKSDTVYCKDNASGVVYLKDNGKGYADLDIDCDGLNADQGKCNNDPSDQPQTAFKDQVQKFGIKDLDAHIHTYVVLGNDNSPSEGNGGKSFDPSKDANIKPLSVVAVVCGDNLFYGVWGDVNGGISTGETSLSLGELCFPKENLNGDKGHSEHDVLYIAFEGQEAVPGASANWKAKTKEEFESSLGALGDKLVKKIGGGVKSRIMRGSVDVREKA